MKDRKQKNPQAESKPRQSFLEWYDARPPFLSRIKGSFIAIVGIPLCIAITFLACSIIIGDGTQAYSDDTYKYIEASIRDSVSEVLGIDALKLKEFLSKDSIDDFKLKEALGSRDVNYADLQGMLPEEVFDALFNNKELPHDNINGSFELSYKNGQNVLVCSIRDGFFFKAEVTATLSENYNPETFERNFNSFQEFKVYFYVIFGLCSILGGLLLWILTMLFWEGILWIYSKSSRREQKEKIPEATQVSDNTMATEARIAS